MHLILETWRYSALELRNAGAVDKVQKHVTRVNMFSLEKIILIATQGPVT